MALHERLRPWHALTAAVFLAGAAWSLRTEPSTPPGLLRGVASGLVGAVVFQFTVGTAWATAVEYHNAGGGATDAPALAVVGLTGAAAAASYAATADPVAAATTAFWAFVAAVVAVSVGVRVAAAYDAA